MKLSNYYTVGEVADGFAELAYRSRDSIRFGKEQKDRLYDAVIVSFLENICVNYGFNANNLYEPEYRKPYIDKKINRLEWKKILILSEKKYYSDVALAGENYNTLENNIRANDNKGFLSNISFTDNDVKEKLHQFFDFIRKEKGIKNRIKIITEEPCAVY